MSSFIPAVQGTTWYANGGIIIVTWDESVGAYATSGDHFAVLRAIEESYGVPLLGGAASPSFGDLSSAF